MMDKHCIDAYLDRLNGLLCVPVACLPQQVYRLACPCL